MIGLRDPMTSRARIASGGATTRRNLRQNCSATARPFASTPLRPATSPAASPPSKKKAWAPSPKAAAGRIQGVIRVSERPPHPGLWILDSVPDAHFMQFGYTNPNDTEGIMDLICAGAQIVLFITGRGSVIGSAVAPLIKVTGNTSPTAA